MYEQTTIDFKHDILTEPEMRALVAKAQGGDMAASDSIIKHSIRLIQKSAIKYSTINQDDLMQEGMIAIAKAIGKYKLNSKMPFTTFAYAFYIRRAHKDFWMDNMHDVTSPGDKCLEFTCTSLDHLKDIDATTNKGGGLASRLEKEMASANNCRHAGGRRLDSRDRRDALREVIALVLTDKKRGVLYDYYGLGDEPPMTYKELAVKVQLTASRVQQIVVVAEKKLYEYIIARCSRGDNSLNDRLGGWYTSDSVKKLENHSDRVYRCKRISIGDGTPHRVTRSNRGRPTKKG